MIVPKNVPNNIPNPIDKSIVYTMLFIKWDKTVIVIENPKIFKINIK